MRSATAQFEKILGLEPGSSAITDTTHKTNHSTTMPAERDGGAHKDNVPAPQSKPEPGDLDVGGGGSGHGGKKMRRKKKRGGKDNRGGAPKGARDGPPQVVMVEKGGDA